MFTRACVCVAVFGLATVASADEPAKPNILVVMADDWGWPFARLYGDPVVKTPNFERVAREGVLFTQAFVASPSCTPSRAALLTGQHFWRLEESANLWSTLKPKFRTYPDVLREAGYFTGSHGKGWGPGNLGAGGRTDNPAGQPYASFEAFLKQRPKQKPFCFWLGARDPHRPYQWQSGISSGIDIKPMKLPPVWPDNDTVRTDLADYYFAVQRFDALVGQALDALAQAGELDNTLIVVSGDNGAPFPRGKTNIYDLGVRVPLAIRWGAKVKPGQVCQELVSFVDLAPTFLEAAGLTPPGDMTGRSLLDLLAPSPQRPATPREFVLVGRERHTLGQGPGSTASYPMRGLRTQQFLYIWNMQPDRWPAGIPPGYSDCDDGPTKQFMLGHHDEPADAKRFDLAFAQRPAEELYDLKHDPDQLVSVAGKAEYAAVQQRLAQQLKAELRATADPRVVGGGEKFDQYPYYGNQPAKKKTEGRQN